MSVRFPCTPCPLFNNKEENDINLSFDHLVACSKKGKAPGKLWCPRGVAIDTTTNHIYVAEGDRVKHFARVSVFSESGQYLNSYTHRRMKSLCGIAIHGNDLYVTDTVVHAVFRVKRDGFSLVSMRGSEGPGVGQFQWPCQLSVSPNGEVFIADSNNHRIQILDSTLHSTVRQVSHPSMHCPRDVQVTADEMYVLSVSDSPCIHVFSHPGHKIRSVITRGYVDGMQVARPFFLCLGPSNCLVVSDFETDQIKIFSNGGTLFHTLGTGGQLLGSFDRPTGLALTTDLKLVIVSSNDYYRLQIISLTPYLQKHFSCFCLRASCGHKASSAAQVKQLNT